MFSCCFDDDSMIGSDKNFLPLQHEVCVCFTFFQPLPLISRCIAKVVSVIPCAPISSCSRSSGQSSACHKCSRAKRILFRIMSCNATNLTWSCARFAKSTHTQARRARYIEGSETAKLSRALSDDSGEGAGEARRCSIMCNKYYA